MFKAALSYFCSTIISLPRTMYAFYCMSRLPKPCVSVFGGTRIKSKSSIYEDAYAIGSLLSQLDIGVITGGGSGVMEAALCGAVDNGGSRAGIGIGVVGVDEGFIAECKPVMVYASNFEIRKRFLSYYSSAFIIFQGGVGTLDEFAEVINLIKLEKIKPVPIILVGVDYWSHIIQWFELAIQKDLFLPNLKKYIMITDDIEHAVSFVRSSVKR